MKVTFDYQQLLKLLLAFIPAQKKLTLSIDRTEWDRGKHQYNILCVIASIGKMGVPLYFELLDNNSGNSNHEDRIQLLKALFQQVGKDRIERLVMDREFIGQKWLSWLKKADIPFCVRVPKATKSPLPMVHATQPKKYLNKPKAIFLAAIWSLTVSGECVD
ncbi:MAG: transposase [Bacteroidia bacterium]